VKFLENVQEHKEAVPMRRYAGGTGRAAQGMITLYYDSHMDMEMGNIEGKD